MSSVCTLTFSPCIDKSSSVPALLPEKKLRCAEPVMEPGGGGINVARAIQQLGGEAHAIFPGGGFTGEHLKALLDEEHVPYTAIPAKAFTRENIIIFEEKTGLQYRFGMPGTLLAEKEWQECIDVALNHPGLAFLVVSGSLPPGVPNDVFVKLSKSMKDGHARLVVDTSGPALKASLEGKPFLIKPNLGELAALAGTGDLSERNARDVAMSLVEQGACSMMLVSMGAAGAMLVRKGKATVFSPPAVKRLSTVGAGDSSVAGMVLSLSRQSTPEDAAAYGVACGTAATLRHGTGLCRPEDVQALLPQIRRTDM